MLAVRENTMYKKNTSSLRVDPGTVVDEDQKTSVLTTFVGPEGTPKGVSMGMVLEYLLFQGLGEDQWPMKLN